jgi:ABC-type Fe3+/spermidine/putrescine transport system ATPase subunit
VPTADPGLSISGLSAQAGSFTLGPVSLDIAPDRVLVVLGPSGAGKTMLLETIAGLRPQHSGKISLAGTDITGLAPERRRIGLVFQDAALFPHLTVKDNIRFGPEPTERQPQTAPATSCASSESGTSPTGPPAPSAAANASGQPSPAR